MCVFSFFVRARRICCGCCCLRRCRCRRQLPRYHKRERIRGFRIVWACRSVGGTPGHGWGEELTMSPRMIRNGGGKLPARRPTCNQATRNDGCCEIERSILYPQGGYATVPLSRRSKRRKKKCFPEHSVGILARKQKFNISPRFQTELQRAVWVYRRRVRFVRINWFNRASRNVHGCRFSPLKLSIWSKRTCSLQSGELVNKPHAQIPLLQSAEAVDLRNVFICDLFTVRRTGPNMHRYACLPFSVFAESCRFVIETQLLEYMRTGSVCTVERSCFTTVVRLVNKKKRRRQKETAEIHNCADLLIRTYHEEG